MSVLDQIIGLPARLIHQFKQRDNSVLGIDVGSSSVKVVQLRKKKGQAVLETYGELALGPYAGLQVGQAVNLSAEKTSEALTDIIREANVTTKRAAFSIPLSSSLTSVIELPKVSERELKDMVPIEARKYIPVPISEVTLDWFVIPNQRKDISDLEQEVDSETKTKAAAEDREKLSVLLVAIHNEVINKYQHIAKENNLDIGFIEIETFSAIRSLLGRGTITFLILDIGANTTNVAIVESGVVYRSHVINRGSQDITFALSKSLDISTLKAEEMKREYGLLQTGEEDKKNKVADSARLIMGGILSEANKTLLDYEKKQHRAINRIVLSGGGSLLKGMLTLAKENLDTEVVYGNPFSKTETPAFLDEVLKEIGPIFSVALGIALRRLQELE